MWALHRRRPATLAEAYHQFPAAGTDPADPAASAVASVRGSPACLTVAETASVVAPGNTSLVERAFAAAEPPTANGRPHEDLLAAIGQLSDGTITHHQVNWLSPLKARTTTVIGDHGILIADTLNTRLTRWANGSSRPPTRASQASARSRWEVTGFVRPRRTPRSARRLGGVGVRSLPAIGRPPRSAGSGVRGR